MSYQSENVRALPAESQLAPTFARAMSRVYTWMALGLLVTAGVAMLLTSSDSLTAALIGRWYIYVALLVAQVFLVMAISAAIDRLAPSSALGLFFLYSALVGITLSVVFLVYDLGTIGLAFVASSATFAAMSIVGLTTKKDLTGWGTLLVAALLGLIVASIANWFLQSGTIQWVLSFVGVIIFMGLTAHDSQAIKNMTAEALLEGDTQVADRVGVLGALHLYLDLVNLFLFILNFMGEGDN